MSTSEGQWTGTPLVENLSATRRNHRTGRKGLQLVGHEMAFDTNSSNGYRLAVNCQILVRFVSQGNGDWTVPSD